MDAKKDDRPGCCATCGFLCKRTDQRGHPLFFEYSEEDREEWKRTRLYYTDAYIDDERYRIACFRGVVTFENQNTKPAPNGKLHDALIEKIQDDRGCSKWMKHQNGLGPYRQLDELKMLELQQRQQQFEEEMELRRRDFNAWLQENRQKEERSYNKIAWTIAIVGIFLAIIEVLVGVFF